MSIDQSPLVAPEPSLGGVMIEYAIYIAVSLNKGTIQYLRFEKSLCWCDVTKMS